MAESGFRWQGRATNESLSTYYFPFEGLLGAVASKIISANASHLVGRSIPEAEQAALVKELETDRSVKSVHDVKATEMGADQV